MDLKHIKYTKKMNEILLDKPCEPLISRIFSEMMVDESFIKILINLHQFGYVEIKTIYKIFKYMLKFAFNSSSSLGINKTRESLKKMLIDNITLITEGLLDNFISIKNECVVEYVGKIFRQLIHIDELLLEMLNFQFFSEIYFFTKSENFFVSSEAFRVISVRSCIKLQSLISRETTGRLFGSFLSKYKEQVSFNFNEIVFGFDELHTVLKTSE